MRTIDELFGPVLRGRGKAIEVEPQRLPELAERCDATHATCGKSPKGTCGNNKPCGSHVCGACGSRFS
jgi:hypothetical protein